MMALPENDADQSGTMKTAFKLASGFALGLLCLFAAGMATGSAAALIEGSDNPARGRAISAASLLVAAASGWALWKLQLFPRADAPLSPRTRKTRNVLVLSGAFGGLIGLGVVLSGIPTGDVDRLFSNGAVETTLAIALIAAWVVFIPLITWMWERSIDEHERAANGKGALAGVYTYSVIAPAAWMAQRGGLVSEVDPMIIFLIVMAVWGIVWGVARRG